MRIKSEKETVWGGWDWKNAHYAQVRPRETIAKEEGYENKKGDKGNGKKTRGRKNGKGGPNLTENGPGLEVGFGAQRRRTNERTGEINNCGNCGWESS